MNKCTVKKLLNSILITCVLGATVAHAEDASYVVVGKNDWLFTRYEFANPADAPDTEATLQLLQKVNKLFERSGIALALVIVPSKIRIYADQLPDSKTIDSYTADKYENVFKTLRSGGVNVVNLNRIFLSSSQRNSDTPLFLHLDTHWAPAGALLAAETVKSGIDGN